MHRKWIHIHVDSVFYRNTHRVLMHEPVKLTQRGELAELLLYVPSELLTCLPPPALNGLCCSLQQSEDWPRCLSEPPSSLADPRVQTGWWRAARTPAMPQRGRKKNALTKEVGGEFQGWNWGCPGNRRLHLHLCAVWLSSSTVTVTHGLIKGHGQGTISDSLDNWWW